MGSGRLGTYVKSCLPKRSNYIYGWQYPVAGPQAVAIPFGILWLKGGDDVIREDS